MTDQQTLREWAQTVDRMALMALADEMPGVRTARKPAIIEWLIDHDRPRLTESYLKTTHPEIKIISPAKEN